MTTVFRWKMWNMNLQQRKWRPPFSFFKSNASNNRNWRERTNYPLVKQSKVREPLAQIKFHVSVTSATATFSLAMQQPIFWQFCPDWRVFRQNRSKMNLVLVGYFLIFDEICIFSYQFKPILTKLQEILPRFLSFVSKLV